jgi:hypothetical protein
MNRIITAIRQRLFLFLIKNSKAIKNDKLYVFLFYLFATGRRLSFRNPKRYSEKLQILKVKENTDPHLGDLVDKFKVRSIISAKIGDKYLNEIYSDYNSSENLDFNTIPYPCVIKTTHDSGTVFPLLNKPDEATILKIRETLKIKLSANYFWKGRETPYKYATPKIICEKYLFEPNFDSLIDYKIFCFNGKVKLLQVTSVKDKIQYVNYYDEYKKPIDIRSGGYSENIQFSLPKAIDEMFALAKDLSRSICHVRIDFYYINNNIIFGEYTFHSDGGLLRFSDDNFDFVMGEYISCCQ